MITKYIVTAALLLTPTAVFAESEGLCPTVEKLAYTVMRARQAGVSMSLLIKTEPTTSPEVQNIVRTVVVEAFKVPRYSVQKNKDEAAEDFAAQVASACYSGEEGY